MQIQVVSEINANPEYRHCSSKVSVGEYGNMFNTALVREQLADINKHCGVYASVGGAPEAYGSRRVCVCVCVCVSVCPCVCTSFACISLQQLKTKR